MKVLHTEAVMASESKIWFVLLHHQLFEIPRMTPNDLGRSRSLAGITSGTEAIQAQA